MIGGTAGTAIGSAIGSVLLPGIGTWVGGAVGVGPEVQQAVGLETKRRILETSCLVLPRV